MHDSLRLVRLVNTLGDSYDSYESLQVMSMGNSGCPILMTCIDSLRLVRLVTSRAFHQRNLESSRGVHFSTGPGGPCTLRVVLIRAEFVVSVGIIADRSEVGKAAGSR